MPIQRRTSSTNLEAQTQESGVYNTALGKRIDELDEAFDDFPDLPSRMPPQLDETLPRATPTIPDLAFELAPPRKNPMVRTSSAANIAAVRSGVVAPARGPSLDSEPPTLVAPLKLEARTSSAANMAAVRPPPPAAPSLPTGARVLDGFDDDNVDIALDIKERPTNQAALTTMSGHELVPPSVGGAAAISSAKREIDPKPGIVAFAGFGLPPESLGATPSYALRVIIRKIQLRDDLRIARLRRIKDVSLYEAALASADESAVTKGLAVIATTLIGGVSVVVAAAAFLL